MMPAFIRKVGDSPDMLAFSLIIGGRSSSMQNVSSCPSRELQTFPMV